MLTQQDLDHCFSHILDLYLPPRFRIYASILASDVYPGLVSCSYIQTIQ